MWSAVAAARKIIPHFLISSEKQIWSGSLGICSNYLPSTNIFFRDCVEMNLFLMCSTRCYSIIVTNCTLCFFNGWFLESPVKLSSFMIWFQSVLPANIVLSAIVSLKLLQHCLKLFEPSWNCSELRISTRRIIFTPLFLCLRRWTGCCKLFNKNDIF